MSTLNAFGEKLGPLSYVKSLTDVTGFGLMGHLVEMCDGSGISARIDFKSIPILKNLDTYLDQKCFPGGTQRNWASYGHRVQEGISERERLIGADPQTSGGLLIAIEKDNQTEFEQFAQEHGFDLKPIGNTMEKQEKAIYLS
jgi:selenide,water dikinase